MFLIITPIGVTSTLPQPLPPSIPGQRAARMKEFGLVTLDVLLPRATLPGRRPPKRLNKKKKAFSWPMHGDGRNEFATIRIDTFHLIV